MNGHATSASQDEAGIQDLSAYHSALHDLVQAEASERYDHAALSSLTPLEARANALVASIRASEIRSTWSTNRPDVDPPTATSNELPPPPPADLSRFPGMDFHGARDAGLFRRSDVPSAQWDRNQQTLKLWRIVRRMPKGALLHCHFDGSVDVRFLLARAARTPNMCIKANVPLDSQKALYQAEVAFLVLPPAELQAIRGKGASIWSKEYTPDSWLPYAEARTSFPYAHTYAQEAESDVPSYLFPPSPGATPEAEAANRFDAYLHSLMTLTPHRHQPALSNSNEAWSKFMKTFAVISGLLGYEPTLRAYVKEMLKSHARDGIAYTEVRMNFFDDFMVRSTGTRDLGHADWVRIFGEAVEETRQELARDEPAVPFWGAKIIYVTVRIVDNVRLRWYCEDCIALKRQFPDLIVGFDLVGHEDPGVTLRTYAPELLRFRRRVAEEGLETVPFVFHAGETLADGEGADSNLYDALLLGTKRLGHALSLARHPHLAQLCKARNIGIEICPISNQLLGYTSSIASHPSLLALLHSNLDVTLSSDDPAIFENFGLSYDFYQLLVSSHATTLASLGVLARRSIRHSLVDDETKRKWSVHFDAEWQRFVEWIVAEVGGEEVLKN